MNRAKDDASGRLHDEGFSIYPHIAGSWRGRRRYNVDPFYSVIPAFITKNDIIQILRRYKVHIMKNFTERSKDNDLLMHAGLAEDQTYLATLTAQMDLLE